MSEVPPSVQGAAVLGQRGGCSASLGIRSCRMAAVDTCRGTSLRRNRLPLGPYRLAYPGPCGGPRGGVGGLVGEMPLQDGRSRHVQGYLAQKKPPFPQDPTVGLCLGLYGGPRGAVFSYERDAPVTESPDLWRHVSLEWHFFWTWEPTRVPHLQENAHP